MSSETFERRRFHGATAALIDKANAIIQEFVDQGFRLTLRQVYYQAVARGIIENKTSEYKRLGDTIKNARRAGLIDWSAIEDRTRNVRRLASWDDPTELISEAAEQYREDLWQAQAVRVEVWIEKDALLGVVESVCNEFRVPYFACRGNNSESEQYLAGKRFEAHVAAGLTPMVLHLGDHDPNGLDMTRDNRDRLAMFARSPVEVRRLALNQDQIERYRPPPNFAKETDSRFSAYAEKYGRECWELDALAPDVIVGLIRREVEDLIEIEAWTAARAREAEGRAALDRASQNWAENFLGGVR